MKHHLPPLPYSTDALAPHISAETLEFHHSKHHQKYVDTLNELIEGTEYEDMALEDIIVKAPSGPLFNNAAQVWNHTFYWNCLGPSVKGAKPREQLDMAIGAHFGSLDEFKRQFNEKAAGLFGSGWTWLVRNRDGSLAIEALSNAGNPLTAAQVPLLTCDVWEHAYYIDYRNARPKYMESFWNVVNWEQVLENLAHCSVPEAVA
ncbi:MAG: superoxide dismutase [Candidatus Competibacteraceae bacterium]|jgi:Fe-Mn family superoxide dismutase|nr:superoxide dismutase [Candidatus Competibacteraceae bacterium]